MDAQELVSSVSLVGAGFSTITTMYFWFARVRNEMPNLSCELIDRELFLGVQTPEKRQVGVKLGLVVANGSTLPNAVLNLKLWAKAVSGEWLELERVAFDKTTPRPLNVPALQTAFVTVNGMLSFPLDNTLEQGAKALSAYVDRFLASPREFKVELKGLNGRRFANVVAVEAAT